MNRREIYTDQMGKVVEIATPPQRIVSLVPSQTELLFDLGLGERIAGLTWFCIHPSNEVGNKTKIGGTKNLKLDKIRALEPDLIIANKEENDRKQIEELEKEFPVWLSDIYTLEDAYEMMLSIGEITAAYDKALALVQAIKKAFTDLLKAPPLKTLYLIWREPYMGIGSQTFIHHMLQDVCGLQNVCGEMTRYPELSLEEIAALSPQLVLLSSEPYPFGEKHIMELQELLPQAQILLADGEMFSWYGNRLLSAAGYLKEFLKSLK